MSLKIAPATQDVARGVGLLALTHLLVDGSVGFLSALLPTLSDRFELTTLESSVLVAALAITTSLTQPLFGAVGDRIGHRGLVVAGVLTTTALLPLSALAPSPSIVLVILAIGGLGSGAFHPAATTAVTGMSPRPEEAIGLLTAGGMVGLALGPGGALLLTTTGAPAAAIVGLAGMALAAVLWRRIPSGGTARARIPAGGTAHASSTVRVRQLLRGTPGRLTAASALSSLAAMTFLNATPLALVAGGLAPTDPAIGLVLATFTGTAAIGTVAGGALARRIGRRPLVVGSMSAATVPLLLTLTADPGGVTFWLTVAASGSLAHLSLPTIVAAAQDAVPGGESAAAGLVVGGAVGTAGLAYVAVGHLQAVLGIPAASALVFAGLLPAAAIAASALTERHSAPAADRRLTPCLCTAPA